MQPATIDRTGGFFAIRRNLGIPGLSASMVGGWLALPDCYMQPAQLGNVGEK